MSGSFLAAVVVRAADSSGELKLLQTSDANSPIDDELFEEQRNKWVHDSNWTLSVQRTLEQWKRDLEGSLACRSLCSILEPMPRAEDALVLLAGELLTPVMEEYLIAYVAAALDEQIRLLTHNDPAISSFSSRAPFIADETSESPAPGSVTSCQAAAHNLLNLNHPTRTRVLMSLQRPITWPVLIALTPELTWQNKSASALASAEVGSDANARSRLAQLLDPFYLRTWRESSRRWLALRWAAQQDYESSDALGLFQDHEEV